MSNLTPVSPPTSDHIFLRVGSSSDLAFSAIVGTVQLVNGVRCEIAYLGEFVGECNTRANGYSYLPVPASVSKRTAPVCAVCGSTDILEKGFAHCLCRACGYSWTPEL